MRIWKQLIPSMQLSLSIPIITVTHQSVNKKSAAKMWFVKHSSCFFIFIMTFARCGRWKCSNRGDHKRSERLLTPTGFSEIRSHDVARSCHSLQRRTLLISFWVLMGLCWNIIGRSWKLRQSSRKFLSWLNLIRSLQLFFLLRNFFSEIP